MSDKPPSKWRDLANKASKWTAQAAKEVGEKSIEVAKATDKVVREEIERQKKLQAEREARYKKEAAEQAERLARETRERAEQEALAAAEAIRRQHEEGRAKEPGIRRFYDNKLNVSEWTTGAITFNDTIRPGNESIDVKMVMDSIVISRALSSMTNGEIEVLRYTDLLRVFGFLDQELFSKIKLSVLYNDGHCEKKVSNFAASRGYADKHNVHTTHDALQHVMSTWGCDNKGAGMALFLSRFSLIENSNPEFDLIKEIRSKILGGTSWLDERMIEKSDFSIHKHSPTSLFIGQAESGGPFYYNGEGSVISVAPPGSGKTQCNVFPNLLSYEGSAIVLDVKGECYEQTAAWRRQNVGPVYRFSPLAPASSSKYNPLQFLTDDPDVLWEESRLLSELLIIPADKNDPSWENRARDVLAGILAWLVRHKPPEERRMGTVIDVISKIGWETFVEDAKYTLELPPLSRLGNSLAVMPEKQLEGVLDAARRHLAVWEGSRVENVTQSCDWVPSVLCDGSRSTIYICIPPNEIESYSPLLRVILSQHIRYLMQGAPSAAREPILFMLDELPRLGRMRPVEEALEVGRQYGIRLWMFAQSLGQLEKTYDNADGMIGSCGVRIYMNPSSHDGTAKRVSEELGYTEGLLDGARRLMVEVSDLTGPDYKDYQIVFSRSARPAKIKKVFAYREEPFKARLVQS